MLKKLEKSLILGVVGYLAVSMALMAKVPMSTNNRDDAPETFTPYEAKIAMGLSDSLAKYPLSTGAEFKFGIIDGGFNGLEAWLDENPKWKEKVTYINLRSEGRTSDGTHGFKVFQVATKVMPLADFVLVEIESKNDQIGDILEVLRKKGVYFASMSLGSRTYMAGHDPSETWENLKLLNKYQITLIKSAGNYRRSSHFFEYRDEDGDNRLEFAPKPPEKETLVEYNKVLFAKNRRPAFNLSWGSESGQRIEVELQLVDKDAKVVASKASKPDSWNLSFRPDIAEGGTYWLRLVKTSEGPVPEDLKFGLFTSSVGTHKGFFNGLESLNAFSQWESPFLITVGSFGKDAEGKPTPSHFSSIGHTTTGELGPNILGPGQLLIDGEDWNGTSYATPFLAALYSTFANFNVKNFMEATSSHQAFADVISPDATGRYGMPDAKLLFKNRCTNSTVFDDLDYKLEADKLVLTFAFSRNCMQGIDYFIHANLRGYRSIGGLVTELGQLKTPDGKYDVKGWVQGHSASKDIENEPFQIEIPFKIIPRAQFGKEVEVRFSLSTYAQWDPVALASNIEEFVVQLPAPLPPEPAQDLAGGIIAAKDALLNARYNDTLAYVVQAHADPELNNLSASDREQLRVLRAHAAYGLKDFNLIAAFAQEDITDGLRVVQASLDLGAMNLSSGDPATALVAYQGCLKAEIGTLSNCLIGMNVASKMAGQEMPAAAAAKMPDTTGESGNIYAVALGLFTGEVSVDEFEARLLDAARSDIALEQRAYLISRAFNVLGLYYLGQGDIDASRTKFLHSATSSAAIADTAMSALFLDKLPKKAKPAPIPADAAVKKPEPGVQSNPDADRALELFDLGEMKLAESEYSAAIAIFSELIQLDPESLGAYLNRARAYAASADTASAIKDYNLVIQRDPTDANPLMERAEVHMSDWNYDEAMTDLNAAIKLAPDEGWGWHLRGKIHSIRSDYNAAMLDFERALRTAPDAPAYTKDIQSALGSLNYDAGPVDGEPGPRTIAALYAWRDGAAPTGNTECASVGAMQFFEDLRYCVSSVLKGGVRTYGPENFRYDPDREPAAWCEGVVGDGAGQSIVMHVDGGGSFRRFWIGGGYTRTDKTFRENNRPRHVRLTSDLGLNVVMELPDGKESLTVEVPLPWMQRWLKLEIVDVYPGTKYQDTCISFMAPDLEYEEELSMQQ
jgi:tetratricopeptide (TPR) repeat protein